MSMHIGVPRERQAGETRVAATPRTVEQLDGSVGAVDVRVCRAEACQSVGAHELADHARRALGVGIGETTPDGSVTLDQVFCLGNCALGPSVTVIAIRPLLWRPVRIWKQTCPNSVWRGPSPARRKYGSCPSGSVSSGPVLASA